jgi:hypothetical protein
MAMGVDPPPPGTTGVPIGTGQKNDERSRAGKSPAARVNLNASSFPRALIPRT